MIKYFKYNEDIEQGLIGLKCNSKIKIVEYINGKRKIIPYYFEVIHFEKKENGNFKAYYMNYKTNETFVINNNIKNCEIKNLIKIIYKLYKQC